MSLTQRFFLTNSAAGYSPATLRGAWDASASAVTKALGRLPSGAAATVAAAETSTTNNWDVLLYRGVSDPFDQAYTFTTSDKVEWLLGVLESNASANDFFHVHIYVTQGNSDTPRGTLLTDNIGATEWPTAAAARGEGQKTFAAGLACFAGDRLVVEIGYQGQNTSATSFTGTLNYGGTSISLTGSGDTNVTTRSAWVELTTGGHLFNTSSVTWNASDKSPFDTLSDGNLLSSYTNGTGGEVVGTTRATQGRNAGLYVVAFKVKSIASFGPAMGFCTSAQNLSEEAGYDPTNGNSASGHADNLSWETNGGFTWYSIAGDQIQNSYNPPGPGDTFYIGMDVPNRAFYVRTNNDPWQGFGGALTGGTTPDGDTTRAAAFSNSGNLVASATWYPCLALCAEPGETHAVEIDASAYGHGLTTFSPWDTSSGITGTGAGADPAPAGSGSGTLDSSGTGAGADPGPAGSGSGTLDSSGSGAGADPSPQGSGAGDNGDITGTGAGADPAPAAAGSGAVEVTGAGAGVDPAPAAAGSGTLDSSGTGAGVDPAPAAAGSGTSTDPITGTGEGDAPAPAAGGSGTLGSSGSGSGQAPAPGGSGSGSIAISGTGSGAAPAPQGGTVLQPWEADLGRVFLYEVTAYKRGTAASWVMPFGDYAFGEFPAEAAITGESVLRFSDLGYLSFPQDTLANTNFDPSISSGLTITRSLPATPEAQRRVNLELGGFQLANPDGSLDQVVRSYAVDGRSVRVLLGLLDFSYDDFAPIFTGRMLEWDNDGTKVSVIVRDEGYRLDRPMQGTLYGGTGGADGGADLAGKPKPMAFGKCLNVSAPLIDAANLVYQVHHRAMHAIDAVYDRGAALTADADYASYALLIGATVATGHFATCLAQGLFRLGSTPSGLVTVDLQGDANGGVYVDTTQAIASRFMVDYGAVDSGDLDAASWSAFATAQPGTVGWWKGTDSILVSDALDQLLGGCAAWWGARPDGLFQVGQLAAPDLADVDLEIEEADIIDLQIMQPLSGTFPPRFRQRVAYQQLFTSQTSQDLAGAVTAARRQFLSQTSRIVSTRDDTIRNDFLLATDPDPLQSWFYNQSDAQGLCDRLLALYGTYRQTVRVQLGLKGMTGAVADTVRITHRRLNSGTPTAMRILDRTDNADDRQVELILWG